MSPPVSKGSTFVTKSFECRGPSPCCFTAILPSVGTELTEYNCRSVCVCSIEYQARLLGRTKKPMLDPPRPAERPGSGRARCGKHREAAAWSHSTRSVWWCPSFHAACVVIHRTSRVTSYVYLHAHGITWHTLGCSTGHGPRMLMPAKGCTEAPMHQGSRRQCRIHSFAPGTS